MSDVEPVQTWEALAMIRSVESVGEIEAARQQRQYRVESIHRLREIEELAAMLVQQMLYGVAQEHTFATLRKLERALGAKP